MRLSWLRARRAVKERNISCERDITMHIWTGAYRMSAALAAVVIATACHSNSTAGADKSMDGATYNNGNRSGDGYFANSQALSALLLAHSVNPAASHHYDAAAGSAIMNVSVATKEVDRYCASNPRSTIAEGVDWSDFKTQ